MRLSSSCSTAANAAARNCRSTIKPLLQVPSAFSRTLPSLPSRSTLKSSSLLSSSSSSSLSTPSFKRCLSVASTPSRSLHHAANLLHRPFSQSALAASVNQTNIVDPSSSLISITTLPNKVRVATEATPGHFSAVGVYIDTGSRLERPWVPGESGVCHLLDRMAYKSTKNKTSDQMLAEIHALGGNVMCTSSREAIMYQSSVFNKDVPKVLSIMADTILNPILSPQELDDMREAAAYEISEIWDKPEMILPELLHTVAYNGNTLGNPLLCPMESLKVMTADNLRNFMQTWYTPDRIVVAGAGMPHEQLVQLTQQLFGHIPANAKSTASSTLPPTKPSIPSSASSIFASQSADFSTVASQKAQHATTAVDLANARAQYTGGQLYLPRDDLEFTHVYLAFEGLSIHDDDIYALATLQVLLGGGGSFSAGGPGKGMYSRLFTNVLNQHHAVDYCAAFHHCYADSGLFGIAASVHPSFNSSIVHVIARELELCTSPLYQGSITVSELERAKNQLKSSLIMALESRLVEIEDLGRQIQAHGRKVSIDEMCLKIDAINLATLHRAACRVLRPQNVSSSSSSTNGLLNFGLGSSQSTVVAQGKLEGLGDLRQFLADRGLGLSPPPF